MIMKKPTVEGRKAERILQIAVAKVIEENRRLGRPVAVMYKGKAALISAEKAISEARKERHAEKQVKSKNSYSVRRGYS